jgi:hypothetical protein
MNMTLRSPSDGELRLKYSPERLPPDISIAPYFLFSWDVVYVKRYKNKHYQGQVGSKESSEIRGRFVGFSKNVGHALTFKILADDTQKIIHRSQVRLASVGENNLKLDMEAGAVPE